MTLWFQKFLSLLLFIVNVVSQLSLLFFSGWFIAACAISGHVGVLAGFNYVVPAAIIRFLALLRISSGYFEKYVSHLLLLRMLKNIRANLLTVIFNKQKNLTQSKTGQALQQQTEQMSAQWSTVISPTVTALSVWVAIALLFLLWWPTLVISWLGLLAVLVAVLSMFSIYHKRVVISEIKQQQRYLDQQRQWLHISTLWHFTRSMFTHQHVKQQAFHSAKLRVHVDTVERMSEVVISIVSLVFATSLFYQLRVIANEAHWVVAFMVFISIRDWLQPFMQAQFARNRLIQTNQSLFDIQSSVPKSSLAVPSSNQPIVSKLEFHKFSWQRLGRVGEEFTAVIENSGLYLIAADTGAGKSSTFDAITGELEHQGQLKINQQDIDELPLSDRLKFFYYGQQHEHFFSGTLAENLKVANPNASEQDMIAALGWAELSRWTNVKSLSIWLGDQGLPISGGEQKRLVLARAYLSNAPVLLLDEPFEGLDEKTLAPLVEKLGELAKEKMIILISHLIPKKLPITETFYFNSEKK